MTHTQFAPRDPETMAETGPQNHPLPPSAVAAYGERLRRHLSGEADADMLAIARRIRRKAEIMRLDAGRGSPLAHDLAEIITLADIMAKFAGADDV